MKQNLPSTPCTTPLSRRAVTAGLLAFGATPIILTPDNAAAALHDKVTPVLSAAKAKGFQGVVVLAHGRHVRYVSATGVADTERKIAMTPDTPFGIASISKRLTSVAVLCLVDEGRMALDAPIKTYLPDYRQDTGMTVHVRHLLSNSSGIPNGFTPAAHLDPSILTTDLPTSEAVLRYASGDAIFAPGARFDYALTNWILTLAMIEQVCARPYAEAMQDLVLRPLGMTHTMPAKPPHAALSYRSLTPPDVWERPAMPFLAAGGGYFSTAHDLLRFANGIYGGHMLSPAALAALTHIEVASDSYALGGRLRNVTIGGQIRRAAWDTGNNTGYRSVLGYRLDGGGTVVILNNTGVSQRSLDELADALLQAAG